MSLLLPLLVLHQLLPLLLWLLLQPQQTQAQVKVRCAALSQASLSLLHSLPQMLLTPPLQHSTLDVALHQPLLLWTQLSALRTCFDQGLTWLLLLLLRLEQLPQELPHWGSC